MTTYTHPLEHGAPGHEGTPGNCEGCHAEEFGYASSDGPAGSE